MASTALRIRAKRPGHWKKASHQQAFVAKAEQSLRIMCVNDWYSKTRQDLYDIGAGGLSRDGVDFAAVITDLYPKQQLCRWKFKMSDKNVWHSPNARIQWLYHFEAKYDILMTSDWLKRTIGEVCSSGGKHLSEMHKGNMAELLTTFYPEVEWHEWQFARVPPNYWLHHDNKETFFRYAEKKLNIREIDDWYKIHNGDVHRVGGVSLLLEYFQASTQALVAYFYPFYDWLPWKFSRAKHSFWVTTDGIQKFIKYVSFLCEFMLTTYKAEEQLNILKIDDWYRKTVNDIRSIGGAGLISAYTSLPYVLSHIYPDHRWESWRFTQVRSGYWLNIGNIKRFLGRVKETLKVKKVSDWEYVTLKQLTDFGCGGLAVYWPNFFTRVFPERRWNLDFMLRTEKRATQTCLLHCTKTLLKNTRKKTSHASS